MRIIFYCLAVSIVLLNIIFIFSAHSFLPLYYVLWEGGVGWYIWRHRASLEARLVAWQAGNFRKFLSLGIYMILFEETFAGISMHLASARSVNDFVVGILQFYAFNLLALPGMILGWYFLMKKIRYTRKEIFVLVGLFGLFAEKVYIFVITSPIIGALLILPTMFAYILIMTPSVLSYRGPEGRSLWRVLRYPLGLIVPIITSVPLILVLFILKAHFPGLFPPAGFVS
jgi:hypothetical protein